MAKNRKQNNSGSEYILMQTMSPAEFSRSPVGTKALFLTTTDKLARESISKTIKASCSKSGSVSAIQTTPMLKKTSEGVYVECWLIESLITDDNLN